jgi:hypothetical protein
MNPAPARRLDDRALAVLAAGVPVLVLGSGASGDPHATYSWAIAVDAQHMRVAVDRGSRSSANLRRRGRAALMVVGSGGLNLLVAGRVRRLATLLQTAGSAPLEVWTLAVDRVDDQSWPGVATSALVYRWPAAQRAAMRRMERAVLQGLRNAEG